MAEQAPLHHRRFQGYAAGIAAITAALSLGANALHKPANAVARQSITAKAGRRSPASAVRAASSLPGTDVLRPVIETVVKPCVQAGFSGSDLVTAVAIALAETDGKANTIFTVNGSTDIGLFALNRRWIHDLYINLGPFNFINTWADRLGLYQKELLDPYKNAQEAYKIFVSYGRSWNLWSVYLDREYQTRLPLAQAAVNDFYQSHAKVGSLGVVVHGVPQTDAPTTQAAAPVHTTPYVITVTKRLRHANQESRDLSL